MTYKIVQIIDRLNVGGPTKYVAWLTSGLPASDFTSYLVTGSIVTGEGDMSWYVEEAGIKPIIIPELSRELSMNDFQVLWKVIRLLFSIKPDLVHTHKAKAGAIGRLAVFIYRILSGNKCKVVHVYHGHIFHSYYGKLRSYVYVLIERMLGRLKTDVILTISTQQQDEIKNTYQIGRSVRHEVIPYGLDFTVTKGPSLNEVLELQSDVLMIGLVGRLCEVKNHVQFIRAARTLKDRGLPIRFVIIGDGHLRPQLEQLVSELDLIDTVIFTGFRDDVMNFYQNLTIATITSLNEGTPFTLIEAMYFRIPVVSNLVGGVVDLMGKPIEISGLPDGVECWEHGLTVQKNELAAYANAIQFLIENEELRLEMGNLAAQFVVENFSRNRFLLDMKNLYVSLLDQKRSIKAVNI